MRSTVYRITQSLRKRKVVVWAREKHSAPLPIAMFRQYPLPLPLLPSQPLTPLQHPLLPLLRLLCPLLHLQATCPPLPNLPSKRYGRTLTENLLKMNLLREWAHPRRLHTPLWGRGVPAACYTSREVCSFASLSSLRWRQRSSGRFPSGNSCSSQEVLGLW